MARRSTAGGSGSGDLRSIDFKNKDACRLATTANVSLSGEQTIDGVLTSSDRILVKDQSDASKNGIYVTSTGVWIRSSDFNSGSAAGVTVSISEGTTNQAKIYICTNAEGSDTVETHDLLFVDTDTLPSSFITSDKLANDSVTSDKIANNSVVGDKIAPSAVTLDKLSPTFKVKSSCRVATTANITLSGEQTIDGVLTSSDRVLVKNQTDASENGIYDTGTGAWSRSADVPSGASASGFVVNISEGNDNSGLRFICDTVKGSDVVATDDLNFKKDELLKIIAIEANTTDLENNNPAASNNNKWAVVQGGSSQESDGLYQSNGTNWIKRLDDSDFAVGTRTDLWEIAQANVTYGATNILLDSNGYVSSVVGTNAAQLFDGTASGDGFRPTTGGIATIVLNSARALGRFDLSFFSSFTPSSFNNGVIKFEYSLDGSTGWTPLTGLVGYQFPADGSITEGANGEYTINSTDGVNSNVTITLKTSHQIAALGYRFTIVSGNSLQMGELKGFETQPFGEDVNCVTCINKTHDKIGVQDWVEDPDNAGDSLYSYPSNALVVHNGVMYKNTSGGQINAGTSDPATNTTDWTAYATNEVIAGNWAEASITNGDSPYLLSTKIKVYVNASSGAVEVDLPASPSNGDNRYIIVTDATNPVTIDGNGNNINGAANYVVSKTGYIVVSFNGTTWEIQVDTTRYLPYNEHLDLGAYWLTATLLNAEAVVVETPATYDPRLDFIEDGTRHWRVFCDVSETEEDLTIEDGALNEYMKFIPNAAESGQTIQMNRQVFMTTENIHCEPIINAPTGSYHSGLVFEQNDIESVRLRGYTAGDSFDKALRIISTHTTHALHLNGKRGGGCDDPSVAQDIANKSYVDVGDSDRRLKAHIKTINAKQSVDIISKLRPVDYKWKKNLPEAYAKNGDKDKQMQGFIAQEVQELLPSAITKRQVNKWVDDGYDVKEVKVPDGFKEVVREVEVIDRKGKKSKRKEVFKKKKYKTKTVKQPKQKLENIDEILGIKRDAFIPHLVNTCQYLLEKVEKLEQRLEALGG